MIAKHIMKIVMLMIAQRAMRKVKSKIEWKRNG